MTAISYFTEQENKIQRFMLTILLACILILEFRGHASQSFQKQKASDRLHAEWPDL